MSKAIITGINGFVGSYLAEFLLQKKLEVHGIFKPGSSNQAINNFKEKIKLHEGDILDKDSINNIISDVKPDYLFHLAALTSPAESFKNPSETVTNNIIGQVNILEAICRKNIKDTKLLTVSSAEVYGSAKEEDLPIDESTPLAPRSPYAVSKIAQDYLGLQYFLSHGLNVVRVRPFNHIGPRQAPHFVVSAFAKQIAEIEKDKKESTIRVGNLDSKRDFTDVRDIVKAYLLLLDKGEFGEVYNIGSGKSHEIREILDMLLSMTDREVTIEKDKSLTRAGEIMDLVCDNKKIKEAIGWQPTTSLKTSLKDTLDYWREVV